MKLTRCFAQGPTVGYTFDARPEFVVLIELPSGAPLPGKSEEAASIFRTWINLPAPPTGKRHRSILFFPTPGDPAAFAQRAISQSYWDVLVYWRVPDVTSGASFLPRGDSEIVRVGEWSARLVGPRAPESLSDFTFSYDFKMDRLFVSALDAHWRVGNNNLIVSEADTATISFSPRPSLSAGSLRYDVTPGILPKMPLDFRFNRVAALDAETFVVSPLLQGRVFSDFYIHGPLGCVIALDPRDIKQMPTVPYSHLEFAPHAKLVSNFLSDQGLRVVLGSGDDVRGGFARLQFLVKSGIINGEQWIPDLSAESGFVPEGDYAVDGLNQLNGASDGTSTHRVLTGTAPTECLHVKTEYIFRFDFRNRPGVLFLNGDAPPPAGAVLTPNRAMHDGGGMLTTSWLTVLGGSKSEGAVFASEPARSPLFGRPDAKKATKPKAVRISGPALDRTNLPFAVLDDKTFIPVFPWAGLIGHSGGPLADLEATHLSDTRRYLLHRQTRFKAKDVPSSRFAVTPQGLIAELGRGADFRTLYFGNPDSTPSSTAVEFNVQIKPGTTPGTCAVDDDLQRALRAEELFLVLYKPTDDAINVFIPSTGIQLRDFLLELKVAGNTAPAIIIKYFRGKALSELVAREDLWACKKHLAPDATSALITDLADLHMSDGPEVDAWNRVWTEPDWQGVVMLNVTLDKPPELFEALGAGMDVTQFNFHHVGLDYLPVKAVDLGGVPVRRTSAFGLLRYKGGKPPAIKPDDQDPAGYPASPLPDRSYTFDVRKLVVLFQRSEVSHFSAEVFVSFSHLFSDAASWTKRRKGTDGVNLVGSYEKRTTNSGESTDVFKLVTAENTPVTIGFKNSWISEVDIRHGELNVTDVRPASPGKPRQITFFVGFNADLVFDERKQDFREFFAVKNVTLERAGLEFDYRPTTRDVKCRFKADGVRADVTPGDKKSFLSLLPIEVKGFRVALSNLFDLGDLHFVPLSEGTNFHFGLELELDFGSLGQLAGETGGLKLPVLLGWLKGGMGFCCGIQFPKWNKEDFEIGFEQFLAVRARKAVLQTCKSNGEVIAVAIVLQQARLVMFGKEWPDGKPELDLAAFVPVGKQRTFAWIFGLKDVNDWVHYVALGHGVRPPANGQNASNIVNDCRGYLELAPGTSPCSLIDRHDGTQDGWLAVADFTVADFAEIWFAVADSVPLYALEIKILKDVRIGVAYRRVNDTLGAFSGELNLQTLIPTIQMGAATFRMATFRAEIDTDGGWLVDLGFPWNNDYQKSFQIEMGIFLGGGGFYIGRMSAAAISLFAIEPGRYGYDAPDRNLPYLANMRALRLGIAMRVGIGRSINLGVLKAEASLSIFAALEGAAAFEPGKTDPQLYAVRGVAGLMVHISAELDFLVLQAKAVINAYVEFGFELRKVVGQLDHKHYKLALPFTLFAEVGIYVHFELWVTIGCVRVKIYDLTFSATWRIEEQIGNLEREDIPTKAVLAKRRALPDIKPWSWDLGFRPKARAQAPVDLPLYVMVLPCVADPKDLGLPDDGQYVPCMASHLMVEVNEGFAAIGKLMCEWALNLTSADALVRLSDVNDCRQKLGTREAWEGEAGTAVLAMLAQHFNVVLTRVPVHPPDDTQYVPVPAWPEIIWGYTDQKPFASQMMAVRQPHGRIPVAVAAPAIVDPVPHALIDFVRLVTESFLAELDRQLRGAFPKQDPTTVRMDWRVLWKRLEEEPQN